MNKKAYEIPTLQVVNFEVEEKTMTLDVETSNPGLGEGNEEGW